MAAMLELGKMPRPARGDGEDAVVGVGIELLVSCEL
jgi:hypothetical protein